MQNPRDDITREWRCSRGHVLPIPAGCTERWPCDTCRKDLRSAKLDISHDGLHTMQVIAFNAHDMTRGAIAKALLRLDMESRRLLVSMCKEMT